MYIYIFIYFIRHNILILCPLSTMFAGTDINNITVPWQEMMSHARPID